MVAMTSVDQQALRVDKNVPLLTLDLLSRIVTRRINRGPPFFSAFHTLAVDNRCSGARLSGNRLTAFHIELMMDEIERAIPTPKVEIIVQCRARRQVLRDGSPLTAGRQNVHEAVHHLTHDHRALVATTLARRDQGFDQIPFVVCQVARIA